MDNRSETEYEYDNRPVMRWRGGMAWAVIAGAGFWILLGMAVRACAVHWGWVAP